MAHETVVTVEGRWAVEAAFHSDYFQLGEVVVECGRHPDLVELLRSRGVLVRERAAEALSTELGYQFHRGVFGRGERPVSVASEAALALCDHLVIPHGIADPGNLGTIIRSAVAFGVNGIVIQRNHGADPYSRLAIRASATAVFRVPVFEVDDLSDLVRDRQENGVTIMGAALKPAARSLSSVTAPERSVVMLGSEKEGLPDDLVSLCDEVVAIEMAQGMDSLNVGSAAAIVFYELWGR